MSKNIMIFGDSYSTFEGLVPEGYAVYYDHKGRPETDVTRPEETWWHQVITKKGYHLVRNDSWSGATIGYTGYDGADLSETSSFLCRLDRLVREGFFAQNRIDTVFVFGGTNDSWSDAPLGVPTDGPFRREDLYNVLPAIACFFRTLREILPEAKIYCLENTELKEEIYSAFDRVCQQYGIIPIPFDYIDKRSKHPTIEGMKNIAHGVLTALNP